MSRDVHPFPKSQQLARGRPRYRRHIASKKAWQAIWDAKGGPCRVCFKLSSLTHLHHIVFREDAGDDLPDNLVPVCPDCHRALHNRSQAVARLLLGRLSDAEYTYMVERAGESYPERAYGIDYARPAAGERPQ